MQSRHPFLRTLLESCAGKRTWLNQVAVQMYQPTPIRPAGESRLVGPQVGATCAATELQWVGYRESPRAATPCRNTMVVPAKLIRSLLTADQKRDGALPRERNSHP